MFYKSQVRRRWEPSCTYMVRICELWHVGQSWVGVVSVEHTAPASPWALSQNCQWGITLQANYSCPPQSIINLSYPSSFEWHIWGLVFKEWPCPRMSPPYLNWLLKMRICFRSKHLITSKRPWIYCGEEKTYSGSRSCETRIIKWWGIWKSHEGRAANVKLKVRTLGSVHK